MQLSNLNVKLSKNSWHRKLQVYTFGGGVPLFPNLCPYFWLTIACLFIGPLKYTTIGIKRLAIWTGDVLFNLGVAASVPLTWCFKVTFGAICFLVDGMARLNRSFNKKKWSPVGVANQVSKTRFAKKVVNMTDEMAIRYFDHLGYLLEKISLYIVGEDLWLNEENIYDLPSDQWETAESRFFSKLEDRKRAGVIDVKEYRKALALWEKMSAYRAITPNWDEHRLALKARREEKWKRNRAARAAAEAARLQEDIRREAARKAFHARVMNIAMTTQRVAKVVGMVAVVPAFAFVVTMTGISVFNFYDAGGFGLAFKSIWSFWLAISYYVQWSIVFAGASLLMIYLLSKLVKATKFRRSMGKVGAKLAGVVLTVGKPCAKIATRFGSGFGLFFMYLKAMKNRQCPHIEWDE